MNKEIKLFIDCPEHKKHDSFDAGIEISEDDYVKMLRDYSKTIGTSNNVSFNKLNVYKIDNTVENILYSKANIKIYDISGNLCDIEELYKIQKNGMGILIIEILPNEMDENFEYEYNFWRKDSMNINKDPEITKDDKIRFLPIKNLKIEIDNHLFFLEGCKLYYEYDKFKIAIIIQKIKEI